MAATSIPPWKPGGDETLPHDFVQVATAHSLSVALVDAAQHLRRTSMLAEAASLAALRQALTAAPGDQRWRQALEGAEASVKSATALFSEIVASARSESSR